MKFLLILTLFSFLETSWVLVTPDNGDYSIEVNKESRYLSKPVNKGYVDIFTYNEKDSPTKAYYVVSVSKIDRTTSYEAFSSNLFKENFLKTCNCTIKSEQDIQYDNFKGHVFNIEVYGKYGLSYGQSINVEGKGGMFNIVYYTNDKDNLKFKSEFNHSINSMKIYK